MVSLTTKNRKQKNCYTAQKFDMKKADDLKEFYNIWKALVLYPANKKLIND